MEFRNIIETSKLHEIGTLYPFFPTELQIQQFSYVNNFAEILIFNCTFYFHLPQVKKKYFYYQTSTRVNN